MPTPNTDQLLTTLEKSRLVPVDIVAELRGRVARAPGKVDPHSITKWLVQKKHLTLEQTLELLAGKMPSKAAARAASHSDEMMLLEDAEKLEVLEDDDLQPLGEDDLVPVEDEQPRAKSAPVKKKEAPRPAKAAAKTADKNSARSDPASPDSGPAPLDDLLGAAAGPAVDAGNPLGMGAAIKGPGIGVKRRRSLKSDSVWESPLMLVGGGVLLFLVIVSVVLYFLIAAELAARTIAEADAAYKGQSYALAIRKYEEYITGYPREDPNKISLAKVHLGLSKMRAAIDGARDWPLALTTCKDVLPEIQHEKLFVEARPELAAMLPKVAEGLAAKAQVKAKETAASQELVAQAEEALELNNNADFVPKSIRQEQKLKEISESLTLTKRELARDARLKEALAAMKKVVAAGESVKAYALYKTLIKDYNTLYNNPELQAALISAGAAGKDQIAFSSPGPTPESTEAASSILSSLVLVNRQPGQAPDVAGRVIFALAEGAAYGLDAATGQVLWRRFVGFDTQSVPRLVRRASGDEAVMIDSVRHELVCLLAANGQLRWRLPLGEQCDTDPLVLRDQVVVATRSGKLTFVDIATGKSPGLTKTPLPLTVSPAADPRERYLYQVADHSNLYVLSTETHKCDEVLYLGHEPGTIQVPPFTVSKYLIVADNNGLRTSTLRVLMTDDDGKSVKPIQNLQLAGHVRVPPQMTGTSNLLIITDLGAIYVYDVGKPGKKDPLTPVATRSATDPQSTIRYFLARGAEFWVAGTGFTKFDIQPASERLVPRGIENQNDVFLQTLETYGDYVFHVRRKAGKPGVVVAAVKKSGGDGKPAWETQLGVPLAGGPVVDPQGQQITAFSQVGGLFAIAANGNGGIQENQAGLKVDPPSVINGGSATMLAGGATAFTLTGPSQSQVYVYDAKKAKKLEMLALPFPPAVAPIDFQGQLLIPAESGHVMLLDALGQNAAEPFLPAIEGNVKFAWRGPTMAGNGFVLVADGAKKLYRLGMQAQPRPHLSLLGSVDLIQPIVSPVAALANIAYAVDDDNRVLSFPLPGLAEHRDWNLKVRVTWGPARVGDCVLLTASDNRLYCFDGKPEPAWNVALPAGPLAGAPLALDGNYVLASISGVVAVLDSQGKEVSKVDVGHPLAAGPVRLGDKLLLCGHDGTLLTIAMP